MATPVPTGNAKERTSKPQETFLKPLINEAPKRQFAVLDIETTVHLEQAFLVGFYDGHTYKLFEDRRTQALSQPHFPEDARGPVSQFLTWLFTSKHFCEHWIYAHNGGSFDFLYLIRWLLAHSTEYSFNVVPLQSSILCLEVTEKRLRGKRKTPLTWTFLDSYRLMNAKLEKLGKALVGQGKTEKRQLDGSIVDEKSRTDVERFYKTLHRNPQRYEYLRQDCVLLYRCLEEFSGMVLGVGGELGMTAPSSAMKTFRRMHLDKWVPINPCFGECECP